MGVHVVVANNLHHGSYDKRTCFGLRGKYTYKVFTTFLESQWLIIMGFFKPTMVYFGV